MDFTTTHTTCPYCACGCGLLLEVLDGRIVATLPSKTNVTNRGKLCIKGWNVHEFVQHPTRLQKPLFRQNGSFQEISWDEEYPFWMTTGTEFAHYLTGTMTRRCVTLDRELPELYTELNREDGRRLRIGQGEILRVSSRRGTLVSKVRLSDRVQPGMIFMPLHYEEAAANLLTNPALDPISKTPEYKVCAVKLERI